MTWNRVISELKSTPEFNKGNKYIVFQISNDKNYRDKFYNTDFNTRKSVGLLSHPYYPRWSPFVYVDFYYDNSLIYGKYNSEFNDLKNDENYRNVVLKLYRAGLIDRAETEHRKIFILDDIIIYVTDKKHYQL